MTLGELFARDDLTGRVLEAHDLHGFAYRGRIARMEERGEEIVLFLEDHSQCFAQERGCWKHLPDTSVTYEKSMPFGPSAKAILPFDLPGGGRGYLWPRGTKVEEVQNALRF